MKLFIIKALLCLGIGNLYSQKKDAKKQLYPLKISVMHESISLPIVTSPFKYDYNPSFLIGTEYLLKEGDNYDLHLSGNVGYYYHKNWESTVFTEIRFGYRYNLHRFSISSEFGVGYAHIFTPTPLYGFEDGKFQEITDYGRSAFQTTLSVTPSYKLSKKENASEIHITYTFAVQIPFSETSGFHQFIGVGYKFYPFKNK